MRAHPILISVGEIERCYRNDVVDRPYSRVVVPAEIVAELELEPRSQRQAWFRPGRIDEACSSLGTVQAYVCFLEELIQVLRTFIVFVDTGAYV